MDKKETFLLAIAVFIVNLVVLGELYQGTNLDYLRTDESAKNITERDFEEKSDLEKKVQSLPVNTSCEEKPHQVLTFEENGRFGNLLMETATLILIGKKFNKTVQLHPEMSKKLKNVFSSLPVESFDFSKV